MPPRPSITKKVAAKSFFKIFVFEKHLKDREKTWVKILMLEYYLKIVIFYLLYMYFI